MKPKKISDRNMPENAGLPHGALRSHSNRPLVKPFLRCADLDRARHGEAVDHRAEHREIHQVAGVDDLPARS